MIDETAMRQILADWDAQFPNRAQAAKACGMGCTHYTHMVNGWNPIQPVWLKMMGYQRVTLYRGGGNNMTTQEVYEWVKGELAEANATFGELGKKIRVPKHHMYEMAERPNLREPIVRGLKLKEVTLYEELR